MIEPPHDETVWRLTEYHDAWAPFDARFDFKPDYYERKVPPIRVLESHLVVDLAPVFRPEGPRFAAGELAINVAALRAFVWLAEEVELIALDWQHPAYRYSPARFALSDGGWAVPVFPNGDYYAHMSPALAWGTFGHPWQQTLTIWGHELIETLGADLLTWLPAHPDSP